MSISKVLYTARATVDGGREGKSVSGDGRLDVALAPPAELGGSGNGTNPEQLFAAGFAACFHSALKLVARKEKLDVTGSTVAAEVGIGPLTEGVGYGLSAHLVVRVPGLDRAVAERLVEAADQVCPYSNATRGNIPVSRTVA
ncbi:peroxiredoxin, Ohr subfamily [Allokutzneria albata]|uniref:Peroxiredoxin, Ohr subfamily n=1 Tax=Allokutzneria albata TaxID=211114 RepID=A0A1H0D8T0_ALLAB|nr:peroxiredoxin, Ohr subfamily [Allokutzneria albata]